MAVTAARLNDNERRVLKALPSAAGWEGYYSAFASIARCCRLNRKEVRRACRSLTRKGLAEYARGLWTESGDMAGSGYGRTRLGDDAARDTPAPQDEAPLSPAKPPQSQEPSP